MKDYKSKKDMNRKIYNNKNTTWVKDALNLKRVIF